MIHERRVAQECFRIVLIAALVLFSHPALAATITVDTDCTLVDAISSANTDSAVGDCTAGSGPDTIVLTADVTLTAPVAGEDGTPIVATDITISGGDFTVARSSASSFRIFNISPSGALSLEDLTVSGGETSGSGGGILSLAGDVTLTNSTISGNSALGQGGGIATVNDYYGPCCSALTLVDSTVSGNIAGLQGGGISNSSFYYGGTISLTNSTVSGNTAAGNGGGIYDYYGVGVSIANSTISGNDAGGAGGGMFSYKALFSLKNTMITGNSASAPPVGFSGTSPGGGILWEFADIRNSIIADNSGDNCGFIFAGPLLPIDLGGNFSDDATCGAGFSAITPGVDFDTTLAGNGGPTETHALLPGSVAIDAGTPCPTCPTDQRGVSRDDGFCDSGPYEVPTVVPLTSPWGLGLLAGGLLAFLALSTYRRRRPTPI